MLVASSLETNTKWLGPFGDSMSRPIARGSPDFSQIAELPAVPGADGQSFETCPEPCPGP
jgi:hypothetical protein